MRVFFVASLPTQLRAIGPKLRLLGGRDVCGFGFVLPWHGSAAELRAFVCPNTCPIVIAEISGEWLAQ